MAKLYHKPSVPSHASLGSLAELDTQFLIAEMQGYAKYTDELKAKVVGLMAGIRAFSATLSKA